MGVIKNAVKWLFTTPEGGVILGGIAAGAGYAVGSIISNQDNKREIHAYKSGLETGISYGKENVNYEDLEVIVEESMGLIPRRTVRTIRKDIVNKQTTQEPENSCGADVSDVSPSE